jgi:23S rRNA pseudouridine1911/1915/1917 synthase
VAAGQVDVAGNLALDPARTVDPRDVVRFDPNRPRRRTVRYSVPLVYLDDEIAVVDKPAGLLSVPTDGAQDTERAEESLLSSLRRDRRAALGGSPYVGALHRLDRGTSGLIAFALTRECHEAGRALFRRRAFSRTYLALVQGTPTEREGLIDAPIDAEYRDGRRRIARMPMPGVRGDEPATTPLPAVTRYRVLEAFGAASLLELTLETGRQHQIRLHMRYLGHPIVGDTVYGRTDPRDGARRRAKGLRPLLHAFRLAFSHPISHATIRLESRPPSDFMRAIEMYRRRRKGH